MYTPKSDLTHITLSQLKTDAHLEGVMLPATDAIGLRANNVRIDEAIFEKVLFVGANLQKLNASDVNVHGCDFSTANCSESSFIRAVFNGGRMTGVDLSVSVLKDTIFEDCKLDMANFRQSKLTNVQFKNCVMHEADFQAAELTNVKFQNCQLEKVDFAHGKLKNVDLRSSQLFNIRGWNSMNGGIIDNAQLISIAPELALQLGITIKD